MSVQLKLRPATIEDAALLLAWRNDPATRKASLTDYVITQVEHRAWLEKSLRSTSRTLWICESKSKPVGTARLDQKGDVQELSWTVAPEARGQGIGTAMVAAALAETKGQVRARIRPENAASKAIAAACGFTHAHTTGGVETWLFPSR